MVKAGIFLMARLWPALSGTDAWFYLVTGAGLTTMVIGAIIALFKNDLKGLLAFSTVSHLGLITMLLGTGTAYGALVAVFHILNHATFKAALFMSAGIVDHETGTRDITKLGGLRRLLPNTFIVAAVAALSMAGIPLFNGFISKEMMLKETTKTVLFGIPLLVPVLATIGALFSAAYSFRYIGHTFLGPVRDDYPMKPHDPGIGMWGPPAFLCLLVVGIGVAPFLAEPLVFLVTEAVLGSAAELPDEHLKIWHGVNAALWMSVVAVVGGLILLAAFNPLARGWAQAGPPAAKTIFDAIINAVVTLAVRITGTLHDGALTRYAAIFGVTVVVLGALTLAEFGCATLFTRRVQALRARGDDLVVVSNSPTWKLAEMFAEAGVDEGDGVRFVGDARKWWIESGEPSREVHGRRVYLDRPFYRDVVADLDPDVVIGDVASLDLAIPAALRADGTIRSSTRLVLRRNERSSRWALEQTALERAERLVDEVVDSVLDLASVSLSG